MQDVLKTSKLQKKARLLEKALQETRVMSADAVVAERLATEAAETEKLVTAIHASIDQTQNATLHSMLCEAEALTVLHQSA